jgi:hypothetical protein
MATNPASIQAYMNPYIQQSLAPQLDLLNQQQALAGQGINARAVGQGAFGGNRATLAQGLNAQNYDLTRQQAIGQGYNQAFQQAQQAQQYGAGLGLQGLNTALQGVGAAQQGYQGATQAGVGLGNLGAQQGQYNLGQLSLQNQIANQQYNLPFQRLNFMQGLMSGLPVSSSTTTGYQAGQNPYLQGIGAVGAISSFAPALANGVSSAYNWATGGGSPDVSNITPDQWASGNFAKGGEVKHYASGGIASIDRKVLNNPTDYSADTVNRGAQDNLFGDVTKLLALDTIAKQKQALQNQQVMQQPAKPPVYQQLQQQAMPQQMAQATPPQGIDSARSNLPQTYAGGGIIAFSGQKPDGTQASSEVPEPKSAFGEDIGKVQDWLVKNFGYSNPEPLPQWIRNIGSYFTRPSQKLASPGDADVQEGGFYGGTPPSQVTPTAPDNGIVIHPSAPSKGGPGGPAAPASTPAYKPADTSGIDTLRAGYENMIKGGEDFQQARKDAETTGLRNLFFNMMNPERGASFVSGLGAAGKEAQAGYEKSLEGIQARKDAQIGKLVSLGLKGEDLKNEAKKMGISEAELQAKLPLYGYEVTKNLATADYMRSGKGRSAGKIASATAYKVMQDFNGYKADPKSAPFFNQLPPDIKKALSLPGTESYNRAMIEFNKILQQEMANQIGMLQTIGGGSTSSLLD